MDELLRINTPDWELTIWSNDIAPRMASYQKMLTTRQEPLPNCELRFDQPTTLKDWTIFEGDTQIAENQALLELPLGAALFFENTQYHFEWVFAGNVTEAHVAHKLVRITEGFRFAKSRGVPRLGGSINTANDLGWLRLPLRYCVGDRWFEVSISLEVLPTKILMHRDLPNMYQQIDAQYPLWRFSISSATEQNASSNGAREFFPLMWLAQFSASRKQFEDGLKIIANAPHNRLQTYPAHLKADKIKGRVGHKLAANIRQDINDGQYAKRYALQRKTLSVDTPENRFIKSVVLRSKRVLNDLHRKLANHNIEPEKQTFSTEYLAGVKAWQKPLQAMLSLPFVKEVGDYKDVNKASLVLQQKTGYSAVYKVWQQLKLYLDFFDQQATISMRSVAQIYEVWCFLAVDELLQNQLGFEALTNSAAKLIPDDLEYTFQKGSKGYFEYSRSDGVQLRLMHEPQYGKNSKPLTVYTEPQRPDIVLEAIFENGTKAYWLFDAKYRIDSAEGRDRVPVDAINQMHRYRDAIIYSAQIDNNHPIQKSRPVAGAFALYPGYFNQQKDANPYALEIEQVSIGAFALLPSADGEHTQWLGEYLVEQLGANPDLQAKRYPFNHKADALYVREAARIPYHGMRQVRYTDLVMTTRIGNSRSIEYIERVKNGALQFYHIPVDTFSLRFNSVIASEIMYLAIAYCDSDNNGIIERTWPVKNVLTASRKDISELQSGTAIAQSDKKYYLFELGFSVPRPTVLNGVPCGATARFRDSMRIASLQDFLAAENFSALESKYLEEVHN